MFLEGKKLGSTDVKAAWKQKDLSDIEQCTQLKEVNQPKNSLGKNSNGITTTKAKLTIHDRVHIYLDYIRNTYLLNALIFEELSMPNKTPIILQKSVIRLSNAHT